MGSLGGHSMRVFLWNKGQIMYLLSLEDQWQAGISKSRPQPLSLSSGLACATT